MHHRETNPRFASWLTPAAALTVLLAVAPAAAQGRRDKDDDGPQGGPSAKATLILVGDKEITDVEVREEKFAQIRYRRRGRRIEDIPGEQVLAIRWEEAPGTFTSGLSQLRANLFDKAVTSFTSARNTAPEGSWLWFHATYQLGEAQLGVGAYADAAAEFKRLLDKDKDHWLAPAAIYGLGQAQAGQKQPGDAIKTFERLDEGFGELWAAKARLGMGDAALAGGKLMDAVKHYNFAKDRGGVRYPDLARAATVGIGKAYVADKKFDRAIEMFDRILATPGAAPDVAGGAWVGKGDCQLAAAEDADGDKNKLKEALISYQTCVVRYAGTTAYPKALYQSAELYQRLGLDKLADAMRKELRSRCPSSPWTGKLK